MPRLATNRLGLSSALMVLVFAWLTTTATAEPNTGGDLLRFLPNHGNSVYEAPGLRQTWNTEPPRQLWRVDIGAGKSAVVEAGGRAFTATETEDKQYAICLDPKTGQTLWKHLLHPKNNRHFTKGPVTSPVIDEDRVYFIPYVIESDVWDMHCPIVCISAEGKELWRIDQQIWATEAGTPLVAGDTLYVAADSPERAVLAAFDKRTGELRWDVKVDPTTRKRELAAPSSLTYQVVDGVPQVVVATYGTREILGVHAESGEIMWAYPYPEPLSIGMCSTPVAIGSRLFVCAGEGKGLDFSACLEMTASDGKINFREVYVSRELQNNMYNTIAVFDNAAFGFAGNDKAGFLQCTDFRDGRLLWQQRSRDWTNEQNLIIADGQLIAITKKGELVIGDASREGFKERNRFALDMDLGRPQQPTIANGRMYIRGMQQVACYQVADSQR